MDAAGAAGVAAGSGAASVSSGSSDLLRRRLVTLDARMAHLVGELRVAESSAAQQRARRAQARYVSVLNRGLLALCLSIIVAELDGFGSVFGEGGVLASVVAAAVALMPAAVAAVAGPAQLKVGAVGLFSLGMLWFVLLEPAQSEEEAAEERTAQRKEAKQLELLAKMRRESQLQASADNGAGQEEQRGGSFSERRGLGRELRVDTDLDEAGNSERSLLSIAFSNPASFDQLPAELPASPWPLPASAVDGRVICSEAELAAVEELRGRLGDLAPVDGGPPGRRPLDLSDPVLVRFVRARKSVNDSEKMFRDCHAWREEKKPEDVFKHFYPSEVFTKYMTGGWAGFDREGRVFYVDRLGQLDVPGILKHVGEEEFLNLIIKRQETHTRLFAESEKRFGRTAYKLTVVLDLKGLSMRHLQRKGLAILKKAAFIDDNYYPERLNAAIIINAPGIFAYVWNIVKLFFHENTREKIQIFSGPATDTILKYVDPAVLPAFLGGDRIVDGDPECATIIGKGGRIPKDA